MFYNVEPANDPDVEPSKDNEEQQDIPTSTKDDQSSEEDQSFTGSTKDDQSSEEEQNFIAFANDEDNLSDKRHVAQTVKTFAFRTVLTTPDL